ncbi:uncharacterized protein LOC144438057 [Glandiceps talaboti]
MARAPMTTQQQNFIVESIDKETHYRMLWKTKYSKEYARLFYQRDESEETPRTRRTVQQAEPKSQGKSHGQYLNRSKLVRNHGDSDEKVEPKEKRAPPLREMRPVSMTTKSLLYNGFSKIGEGRYSYLEARKKKKPYDKYEYPMTNSWEYGWKIDDYMKYYTPPKHGVTHVVQDSFYRKNGVPLDESEYH